MIAKDLHFDMLGPADIPLDEILRPGRTRCRLRAAPLRVCGISSSGFFDDPHPASAAAEAGLDDQRKPDLLRGRADLRPDRQAHHRCREWSERRFPGQFLRGGLIAKDPQQIRRRPDERDVIVDAGLRQIGVFGEKSIARVDRIDAVGFGDIDQRLDIQIPLTGSPPWAGPIWYDSSALNRCSEKRSS